MIQPAKCAPVPKRSPHRGRKGRGAPGRRGQVGKHPQAGGQAAKSPAWGAQGSRMCVAGAAAPHHVREPRRGLGKRSREERDRGAAFRGREPNKNLPLSVCTWLTWRKGLKIVSGLASSPPLDLIKHRALVASASELLLLLLLLRVLSVIQ